MAGGEIKQLSFSDGTTVTPPSNLTTQLNQLESYASDAAFVTANGTAAEADIYYNTTDDSIRYYAASAWREVVDGNQVLAITNKDIDGGTASNTSRVTIPKASKSTLDGLTRKQGTLLYASDEDKFYKDDGSNLSQLGGAGAGGINLIQNSDGDDALDQSQTNDVQDWIDSGSGTTSSKTTTASEIALNTNKDNAIKITTESSGSGYTRNRFTMPESLKNWGNMPLSFYQRVIGAYADDDLTVELYTNGSSNYGGAYTQVEFSDGWDGTIKSYDGKRSTAFPVGTQDYWEVRINRTGGAGADTTGIGFNDFRIGPDPVLYTPNVAEWKAYTPAASAGFGTISSNLEYKVVGDSIFIRGDFTTGTSTATEGQLGLPTGYTISGVANETLVGIAGRDSSLAANVTYSVLATNGDTYFNFGYIADTDTTNFMVPQDGNVLFGNSNRVSFTTGPIQISELTGTSQTVLGQNDVEYAYNYSTSTTTDTTSFAWGPEGIALTAMAPGTTANVAKHVKFNTPITSTDTISMQFSDDGGVTWNTQRLGNFATNDAASTFYGWDLVNVSADTVSIRFYSAADAATAWSALSSIDWRVVKHRSGIVTNFGSATADREGIVKKDRWQELELAADVTSNVDFLEFTGLTIGKIYTYSGTTLMIIDGTDDFCNYKIYDGTTNFKEMGYFVSSATLFHRTAQSFSFTFKAATTSIKCKGVSLSANSFIEADATYKSSWATLIEHNSLGDEATDLV